MLIGITGQKRNGKDTIADHLCWEHGYTRFGLADPMRRFAMDLFGWSDDWIENHKEEIDPEYGISYRQFMTWFGTEGLQFNLPETFPEFDKVTGRKVHVRRLTREATKKTVVSDIRFPHEEEEIHRLGGVIIRVIRPGFENDDDHGSESEALNIKADYEVINDGSISDLNDEIDFIMDMIRC